MAIVLAPPYMLMPLLRSDHEVPSQRATVFSALASPAAYTSPYGDVYAAADANAENTVARWDGTSWSDLNNGISMYGGASTIAIANNGDVYAGGLFTRA